MTPIKEDLAEIIGKDEILRQALDTYGIDNQVRMLFEEHAELQDALCKLYRHRASRSDVITEIADVTIMCRQMALHFGAGEVEAEIKKKLDRLKDRLTNKTKDETSA